MTTMLKLDDENDSLKGFKKVLKSVKFVKDLKSINVDM